MTFKPKKINNQILDQEEAFLIRSSFYIAAVAAFCIALFCINNFMQGRIYLGLLTSFIVVICLTILWGNLKNRYQPLLFSLLLLPIVAFAIIMSFKKLGLIGTLWIFPMVLAIFSVLKERHAWLANSLFSSAILFEVWATFDSPTAIRLSITFVATILFVGIFKRHISTHHSELEKAATEDSLTGLLNRSRLNSELELAYNQFHRLKLPMSMLVIDIDKFKNINDTFGHLDGDKVLSGIGHFFKQRFRPTDTVFRIGGEEFLIILCNTNITSAKTIANRLLKEIETLSLLPQQKVTVSIGIAELKPDDDVEKWMIRGDENLYTAKSNGRNQAAA